MSEEGSDQLRALGHFLVGPAEIGELLGVEPNTVNVWKKRDIGFPEPVRKLRSGEIWDAREIRAWAEATGRPCAPEEGNR